MNKNEPPAHLDIFKEKFIPFFNYEDSDILRVWLSGITYPNRKYRVIRDAQSSYFYVLEYVVHGRGYIHHDNTIHEVKAGDIYLLEPNSSQEYWADEHDPFEKIWFDLGGRLIDGLYNAYGLRGRIHFPKCDCEQLFRDSIGLLEKPDSQTLDKFALKLHEIFLVMHHSYQSQLEKPPQNTEAVRMKQYLDSNWRNPISLGELAKSIRKSKAQALRLFENTWKMTPHAYLQNLRLFLATQYLGNTDSSIKGIALMIGFNDEFYFSNWFKHKMGMSPTTYRELPVKPVPRLPEYFSEGSNS